MINAYKKFLKNYFNFKDRTTRKDFWLCVLVNCIISFCFIILSTILGDIIDIIYAIFAFAILIPGLAQTIRRLHDANKSVKYFLICFIPIVGIIMFIIALASPSIECDRGIQL